MKQKPSFEPMLWRASTFVYFLMILVSSMLLPEFLESYREQATFVRLIPVVLTILATILACVSFYFSMLNMLDNRKEQKKREAAEFLWNLQQGSENLDRARNLLCSVERLLQESVGHLPRHIGKGFDLATQAGYKLRFECADSIGNPKPSDFRLAVSLFGEVFSALATSKRCNARCRLKAIQLLEISTAKGTLQEVLGRSGHELFEAAKLNI